MQQASPRKKAPEQVRQSILQHAICLAAEKGVTGSPYKQWLIWLA